MATSLLAIRVPLDVSNRHTRLAKETGRSRSYYINEALSEPIDRLEYEYGILNKVENWHATWMPDSSSRLRWRMAGKGRVPISIVLIGIVSWSACTDDGMVTGRWA